MIREIGIRVTSCLVADQILKVLREHGERVKLQATSVVKKVIGR